MLDAIIGKVIGKTIAIARRTASYEDALHVSSIMAEEGARIISVTQLQQIFHIANPSRKKGAPPVVEQLGTVIAVFATVRGDKRKARIDERIAKVVEASKLEQKRQQLALEHAQRTGKSKKAAAAKLKAAAAAEKELASDNGSG